MTRRASTVREPPSRFALEWRNANFALDERTELEVLFQPGQQGAPFSRMM